MGELGPGLGSEALGVQFSRDLLKGDSLITQSIDELDGFRFSFDHLQGTLAGVPSLALGPIAENAMTTREGSVLPNRFPAARLGSRCDHGPLIVCKGGQFINRFNPKSQFHLSLGIIKSQRTNKANGQRQKRNQNKCVTLQSIKVLQSKQR
jgi:hypothetical protein